MFGSSDAAAYRHKSGASRSRCVLGDALLHPFELLRGRVALVMRLPLRIGHPVHGLARRILVKVTRLFDPVGQAIATKTGEPHQVDILRVFAVAEVADQAAKGLRRYGIVQSIERVGFGIHSYAPWLIPRR
ncbi:hypothetical protein SPHINGO391_360063 [Sphingomonas aurantiaca]|uniref:Uncharacterized protein n=1 Tax=Sphingomonas aurantiaca TaxID=185949 RepID=A0A5E7YEX7_9SPHN|nr:hypothetical protein SPHINGO391_360063 [Sphingomonas aurantiaca]